MSYLSLLEKFNKTDSRLSRRGEFFNFQLFSLYGMVMGNFFHLSVCRFAAKRVSRWRFEGQSIVQCNYWWCVMPFSRATKAHVAFSCSFRRIFRKNKKFGLRFRVRDEKERKRPAEVGGGGDKKGVPRNSASYARWHFQTTKPSVLEERPSPPAPVLPHSAAVAEKFKFTHRLPRVCFSNLWKMSLAGRGASTFSSFSSLRHPRSATPAFLSRSSKLF